MSDDDRSIDVGFILLKSPHFMLPTLRSWLSVILHELLLRPGVFSSPQSQTLTHTEHRVEFESGFCWRLRMSPEDYCHGQPQYYRITVRLSDSCCCSHNYSAVLDPAGGAASDRKPASVSSGKQRSSIQLSIGGTRLEHYPVQCERKQQKV